MHWRPVWLDSVSMDDIDELLNLYLDMLDEAEQLDQRMESLMAVIAQTMSQARLLDAGNESASLH